MNTSVGFEGCESPAVCVWGGAECQASWGKKRQPIIFHQSAEYPCATTTVGRQPIFWCSHTPQRFGCRPVANELLNVAMYDSICIMHEIVSGKTAHTGSSVDAWHPKKPPQSSKRGTSKDSPTLHRQAASSTKAPRSFSQQP